MAKRKKDISAESKIDTLIPITKGALLDYNDNGVTERKVEIGKTLKVNISMENLIIPAEIANKKVVDYFVISTLNPFVENKFSLQAGDLGPESTYTSEGLKNLTRDCSVSFLLNKMNFKPAFIQIQVSTGLQMYDNGFNVNISNDDVYQRTLRFRSIGQNANGPEKKHYLSFYINQVDTGIMSHRFITLNRSFIPLVNNWSFYKMKVFILETQL